MNTTGPAPVAAVATAATVMPLYATHYKLLLGIEVLRKDPSGLWKDTSDKGLQDKIKNRLVK